MARTPLPLEEWHYQEPVGPLVLHALATQRDNSLHDLVLLVRAVDAGEVPLTLLDENGLPVLASGLRHWWRARHKDWPNPEDPDGLARFEPGLAWDGKGLHHPFEALAAALLSAGANPFPDGQLVNLRVAIQEGAAATAVSLLALPDCPDLSKADPQATLLRQALEKDEASIVHVLLDKGVDPNALDEEGTPAWFAVRSPARLSRLVRAGAQLDLRDGKGRAAPQAWSSHGGRDGGRDVGQVRALGQALARLGKGISAAGAADGAFAAGLKVGALRTWLAQDPSAAEQTRPVPKLKDEHETLAQRAMRQTLDLHKLERPSRPAWDVPAPPLGVLRLLMAQPSTPEADRHALALLAACYGHALQHHEKGALKAFGSLVPALPSHLQRRDQVQEAWETLGTVLDRIARGACPGRAYHNTPRPHTQRNRALELLRQCQQAARKIPAGTAPYPAPAPAMAAAFHRLLASQPLDGLQGAGSWLVRELSAAGTRLVNTEQALGALLAAALGHSVPEAAQTDVWDRAIQALGGLPVPAAHAPQVRTLVHALSHADPLPEAVEARYRALAAQLMDQALDAPAPARPRPRM